jgi:hypothetical protein
MRSEHTDTRSSVGSRKCVSDSWIGCSECRYSRYSEMSVGCGGERAWVALNAASAWSLWC